MNENYICELLNMSDESLNIELGNVSLNDFREALRVSLLSAKRDTRHACAEAVNECDSIIDAHNACMRVDV